MLKYHKEKIKDIISKINDKVVCIILSWTDDLIGYFGDTDVTYLSDNRKVIIELKKNNMKYGGNIITNIKLLMESIIFIHVDTIEKILSNGRYYINDNIEIVDIVNNYGKTIILLLSEYYNINTFIKHLKNTEIEIFSQGDKKYGYIVIIRKN